MKKLILSIVLLVSTQLSKAQTFETFILAADDASTLGENYVAPAVRGLMYSMNGGWYTTAKTHKLFGFDITINANAAFVPSNEEIFAFNPNNYTFLSLPNGETTLNTLMSENDSETVVDIRIPLGDGTFKVASFNMPGGIADELPFNAVPSPMVQFGFGIPLKTDLKFRFVPTLTFDDNIQGNLIGFGLQHDIMQYFGPLEKLPLNLSILAAFTAMKVNYEFTGENADEVVILNNADAEFKMNTWTIQALASLDFKIISFYGGIGYNTGNSTAKMRGEYGLTYDVEDSNGNVIGNITETVVDPINLDFSISGIRGTLGTRLNIGFFKIFADYTIQEFNTASAGIAFSFR